jgi:hypothetical protein
MERKVKIKLDQAEIKTQMSRNSTDSKNSEKCMKIQEDQFEQRSESGLGIIGGSE